MSSDEDEEAERPARKKQRTGAGGGKRCVCGPNGCKRVVNSGGFRLPANMPKRLAWLHCFYPRDAVPDEFTQPKAGNRRVDPCHFRPDDLELRDRQGGSGTCSLAARASHQRSDNACVESLWQSNST